MTAAYLPSILVPLVGLVFPAIAIICFPEILFLWLVPALILLVFGGWIPEEKIWGSIEKISIEDDNIN